MSGAHARARTVEEGEEAPPAGGENDIEARARLMGWRPLEDWKKAPALWKSAEDFVRAGEQELPLVRDRNRRLEDRLIKAERDAAETRQSLDYVSNMTRKSEERAYARARADLEAERLAAVASGDTAAFSRAEAEMKKLEAEKPEPPPKPAAPTTVADLPAEVREFGERNPWFHADQQLRAEAIAVHGRLLQAEPGLTLAESLVRTESTVRAMFPHKFPAPRAAAPDPADAGHVVEHNPARGAPAAVGSPAAAPAPRRAAARSFDSMPKESKDAFHRYAKQLEGKGTPLTQAEWADTYWSQED